MHTRTAAGTLAAALLLTACSAAGTTAKPKPSPTISKREQFLNAVHAADFQSWSDKSPTDDDLAAYPTKWCRALASGHSVDWMFSIGGGKLYPSGWDWGTRKDDAHELLLLAVKVYCPASRDQVVEELRGTGAY